MDVFVQLLETARAKVLTTVNSAMMQTNYQIEKLIVENEQNEKSRTEYGKATLKTLSKQLTEKYGRGFSERNLEQMRYFYLTYSPSISQTPSAKSAELPENPRQILSAQIQETASLKAAAARENEGGSIPTSGNSTHHCSISHLPVLLLPSLCIIPFAFNLRNI